jgi:hypothetical protein
VVLRRPTTWSCLTGRHHTFHQFGSATFRGAETFLSRFVLVEPIRLLLEAAALQAKGVSDPFGRLAVDPDRLVWICQAVREVRQDLQIIQPAFGERERAHAPQRRGGIGAAAPGGFELNVSDSVHVYRRLAMAQLPERQHNRVLRGARWVQFGRMVTEPVKRSQQIGDQLRTVQLGGNRGGSDRHIVVAVAQRHTKPLARGVRVTR